MGNKQGGGDAGVKAAAAGSSDENLYERQRSKHKTMQDILKNKELAELSKETQGDKGGKDKKGSKSNSNSGAQETVALKPASEEKPKEEVQKATSLFASFADDIAAEIDSTKNLKPSMARAKTGPTPSKKKKIPKKKKRKVYTPSGYDLSPAVNITPDEQILDGYGVEHVYKSVRVIAEGGSCSVLEVIEVETGRQFALKQMLSDHKYNPSMYEQEIIALTKLQDQVNVLKHHDHWMDRDSLYLITEYCAGGSLLDKILSLEQFSEDMAAGFVRCILEAISSMHEQNLIHRDLKPENIVFSVDPYGQDVLKIIDFGDSIIMKDGEYTTIYAGTRPYMAPQLFKTKARQYFSHLSSSDRKRYYREELKKADVWSVGVIAYVMVCGRLPFNGSRDRLPALICRGKYRWPRDIEISDACKDFVSKLLVFDPEERLSAREALQHEWLSAGMAPKASLGPTFRATLREFNSTTKLTKLLVKTIWNVASSSERKLIKYGLKKITAESEGVLTTQQMFDYMMNFCHVNENDQFYVQCTADELRSLMDIPEKGVHIDEIDIQGLMSTFSIARDASIYGGQLAGFARPKLQNILEDESKEAPSNMNEKDAREKKKVVEKIIETHNKMAGKKDTKYDPKKVTSQMVDSEGVFDPNLAWSPNVTIEEAEKKKKRKKKKNKN